MQHADIAGLQLAPTSPKRRAGSARRDRCAGAYGRRRPCRSRALPHACTRPPAQMPVLELARIGPREFSLNSWIRWRGSGHLHHLRMDEPHIACRPSAGRSSMPRDARPGSNRTSSCDCCCDSMCTRPHSWQVIVHLSPRHARQSPPIIVLRGNNLIDSHCRQGCNGSPIQESYRGRSGQ